MRKINYKSDFDVIFRLKDCTGKKVPFPQCDWSAVFWTEQFPECDLPEMFCTGRRAIYRVSCEGGVCTNCIRNDDGSIHFIFNNHRLGKGVLQWEPHFKLPNDIYPDGVQDLFRPEELDIELVEDAGDCPTTAEIDVMLPYIKGEPFRYEDFTPEQIEGLQKPATDAADKLDEFVTEAKQAEKERETAETDRGKAEETRRRNESVRISSETAREKSEVTRVGNETARQNAETLREQAEQERMKEFATYRPIIDSKQDALNTSEDLEISEANVLSLTERAKQRLFDDMWLKAVGGYGTVDHTHYNDDGTPSPYYLNELWLTYDEALRIHDACAGWSKNIHGDTITGKLSDVRLNIRTAYPLFFADGATNLNLDALFQRNRTIEVIRFVRSAPNNRVAKAYYTFYMNDKLRYVYGSLEVSAVNTLNYFISYCPVLETIYIEGIMKDLPLPHCPKISLESFQYMIDKAKNTTSITITVDADVYAKLTGDTTNEAAAALTAEELAQWQELVTKANEKNISFATV